MSLVRIKIKRDTAANYTASNIVLLLGEFAYETDTFTLSGGVRHYKFKIGDGSTAWVDLPYARLSAVGGGGGASAFTDLTDVPQTYVGQGGKYLKCVETEDGLEFEVIEAADLPSGIDAAKIGDGSVTNAEFQRLDATSSIQTQLDSKLPSASYTAADVLSKLLTVDGPGSGLDADLLDGQSSAAYEQVTNKATDFSTVNDTKYPTVEAVAEYVATAVSGLYDDRGNFDASVNTFPATGGSGTAGAVLKGDIWTISVAGTLGGSAVEIGDLVRALTDTPGQTASNWAITQNNITYVPENQVNKEDTTLDTSTTKYPTNRLVKEHVDLKAPIASPTFTGTVTTPAIIVSSETADRVAIIDSTKNVKSADTATYPSLAELAFVKGVTSALQTQLNAKASSTFVDAISGFIETVADKTYKIVVKIPFACTINETVTISASGTATATFKINTTALGGTANSVSASEQTQAHSSANTVAAGDDIQITISSNAACLDMSFTIKFTRDLA